MPIRARFAIIRERYPALSPREMIFVVTGTVALLLFLFHMLTWSGSEEPSVELAEGPPPAAALPPAAMPATPPPPAVAPLLPQAVADPASLSGLILRGVSGGGPAGGAAIFGTADGGQRVVRVGRAIAPGILLREVGLNHAIATSGADDIRLDLNKAGGTALPLTGLAPALPAPAAASEARATMQYRLGLQPVQSGGRTTGYAIKPGAELPGLSSVGLRPGDVIVAVNGSGFDEERLMELGWQIGNSDRVEFEFIREGKRMKAALGPSV